MADNQGLTEGLTISEWHQMMDTAETERDRMLVFLLFETGSRLSEVIQLQARDCLVEDRAIRLQNLKRKKGTTAVKLVAVRDHVLRDFQTYCKRAGLAPQSYLFTGRDPTRPINKRQARRIFYVLASRAGVFRTSLRTGKWGPAWPHTTRHGYAKHLLLAGVDVAILQKQLGHSQIGNTIRYLSLFPREAAKVLENVDI